MASIEARLQAALIELRQVKGSLAVQEKQNTKAEELVEEVQSVLSLILPQVIDGVMRRHIDVLDKKCMDWRRRQL